MSLKPNKIVIVNKEADDMEIITVIEKEVEKEVEMEVETEVVTEVVTKKTIDSMMNLSQLLHWKERRLI